MSKYLTLTITKVNIPTIRLMKRKGFNLTFLNSWNFKIAMIGIVILLGLFYVFQTNSLSTKNFKIEDLEKRINQLKTENQALELKAVEIQSSHELQGRIQDLKMVAIGRVEYLSPTADMVAIAK